MANAHDRTGAVHLLADHLDAILASCEDLVGLEFDPSAMIANGVAPGSPTEPKRTAEQFARQVSALELGATLRVIAARTRAEELVETDTRFEAISRLFLGGTVALVDAAERVGVDAAASRTSAGAIDPVSYLRARGVISENQAGLPDYETVVINEDFRLCGIVEIGGLMDMTAAFLDALEIHYELFPTGTETGEDVSAPLTDPKPLRLEHDATVSPKLN